MGQPRVSPGGGCGFIAPDILSLRASALVRLLCQGRLRRWGPFAQAARLSEGNLPALPLASPQCVFAASRSFQSAEQSERSCGVRPVNARKARASTHHRWEPYAVGLQGAG
jgi:hypothetical protein